MRNISSVTYLIKRFISYSNIKNVNMKYLNVAEKHDAAKTIAGFLSKGSARRREGFSVYNKIFDFEANVHGQNAKMVMTSVSGHLLNYEFLISYKNWKNCDPEQLFDAPIRKSCTEDAEKIKKTLEREIKSCQGLIVWTDCDREGENIGFEIINVCKAVKPNLQVYRAKFSEITGAAVRRALANLIRPDQRQSDAVDIRQELDLRTGAAFTRFQTMRLQRLFPTHIADNLISYGSCQIPTLGFVARRYKEVEEFVSEPFWKIKVTHTIDDLTVEFTWERNRLFDKDSCEDYLMLCLAEPTATVVNVTTKPKNKWRPCPMDTVELEKLGSRKLKLGAKEVMTIAEKLYTKGIISYPRTETTIFSSEINLRGLVEKHTSHPQWGEFAQRVLNWGPNPRKGNKSDQAHPPIHPIQFVTNLTGNEQRVYELIVRHFLACLSKDATGSETIVNITIAGEKFHATGLCIYERNYLDIYIYDKWNAKQIHRYEINQKFDPTEISMQEGCTTAPPLLTEADLIALMEKHGIGTDATHAEHIHKIKERGYIGEAERGLLVPGTIGMGLYEGYDAMELSLAYPMLRAEFESDLKKICDGEKDPKEVLREQIIKYKEAYRIFTEKITALDEKVANRLNGTIQEAAEDDTQDSTSTNATTTTSTATTAATAATTNRLEELFTCPKCKQARMALRRKKDNSGFYLGCLNFPDCRNSVWFSDEISNINISTSQNHCNRCGPGYRMLKIKFKRNNYLILLNATSNTHYTTCIGCDSKFREIFDINVENIKCVGRIVNNNDENNAQISTTTRNDVAREQRNNNANGTHNNTNRQEISSLNSREFSTNVPSSNNQQQRQERSNSNSRYRGWFQNNETNSFSNNSNDDQPETRNSENNDNFFDDDGFDDIFINNNLEILIDTDSNNMINQNFNSDNNSHSTHNQQNNDDEDLSSIWGTRINTTTTGNNWRSSNNYPSTWPTNNSTASTTEAVNIPWGRKARAEMDSRDNTSVLKCSGCHQPAKEFTVRKDGPNKGRLFYKCPKQSGACQFFVWSDEVNQLNQNENTSSTANLNSNQSMHTGSFQNDYNFNSSNLLNTSMENIMCRCQKQAKSLTVRKDGPNKGRNFYACSEGRCGFFKWADENENQNSREESSWGTGSGNSGASTSSWGTGRGDSGASTSSWGTGGGNSGASTSSWGTGRGDSGASTSSWRTRGNERASNDRSRGGQKRRRCGLCRQEGHTKLKCPRKDEFDELY